MRDMKKIDLAYLAGIIDADGTIGIKPSTYSVRILKESTQATYSERIHIRQVERPALELLAATFGGNIGIEDPNAKRGKPLYRWGQTDLKACATLRALLPYLRIKRRQAENCLALRKLKEQSKIERVAKGRGHVGAAKRSWELSNAMEGCYAIAKDLNRVGV